MRNQRELARHFDASVPLVLVKVGAYPLHHGALGAARSLGRLGVPTWAMVEDRFTPIAVSRFLSGRFVAASTGLESDGVLLDRLITLAKRIGRRSVAVATDDEAAVLLATHADELEPFYLLPKIEPALTAALASKCSLYKICVENGVATPAATFVSSPDELAEVVENARFPIVAKSVGPWERLHAPTLRDPCILRSPNELIEAARDWGPEAAVTLQQYLPREVCVDWIFHGYFDASSSPCVAFTGVKYRSWPPYAGPTSYARVVRNDRLRVLATDFLRRIGYRGVVDMDWRYDRRDDTYNLLDCNPRVGAQFRLFETSSGVDVVRAMHLDLTGRAVPPGDQLDGRGLVVEHYDARAVFAYKRIDGACEPVAHVRGPVALSWLAWDDPLPAVALAARLLTRVPGGFKRRGRAGRFER